MTTESIDEGTSGGSALTVGLGHETKRKIFVCVHCHGIYADQPASACDCMDGTGHDFVKGVAIYTMPNAQS